MTRFSDLFPDNATLLARVWFKVAGAYNFTVPASSKIVRATAQGCGGQGDNWGGGGAFAQARKPVTPGENLLIQVGSTSTASTPGDSFVKYNSGVVICYADRGRGNMSGGKAINSIGDVTRDGIDGSNTTGLGGASAGDTAALIALGYTFVGATSAGGPASLPSVAGPGGGGKLQYWFDEYGIGSVDQTTPICAGPGLVCLELFDGDPGY